jgi:hypothetical protein
MKLVLLSVTVLLATASAQSSRIKLNVPDSITIIKYGMQATSSKGTTDNAPTIFPILKSGTFENVKLGKIGFTTTLKKSGKNAKGNKKPA